MLFSVLYNYIIIPFLFLISKVYEILNKEYRARQKLSKDQLENLIIRTEKKVVWIHASSMGEFEQAKFIIEKLKNDDIYVIVSFFSPSAYDNQKHYDLADQIIYIPFDSKKNAREIVQKIDPEIFILIRYDFWFNILNQLKISGSKSILINATKPSYSFLNIFYKSVSKLFDSIYTANRNAFLYYKSMTRSKVIEASDTRYDRILNAVESAQKLDAFKSFSSKKLILVCGSTWEEDERLLSKINDDDLFLIIVPHKPNKDHIKYSQSIFNNAVLLSEINEADDSRTIIVDSIGGLLALYGLADIAYVGGGSGAGLHSVSEPAGYGLPIIVSGGVESSIDARSLAESKSLFEINNSEELREVINKLKEDNFRTTAGESSKEYIKNNAGTSDIVLSEIAKYLNS